MLVLSRDKGQRIIINDDITISILGVSGNQVRVGIDAPREVSVHREEIYQRIAQEKLDSVVETADDVGATE